MTEKEIFIEFSEGSKKIRIQCMLHMGESTLFIIGHPHPKLGGNMDNFVVKKVSTFLQEKGYSTLRFNFRGVGKSTGKSSWTGSSELNDVIKVLIYSVNVEGIEKLVFVGYSFSSAVVLKTLSLINAGKPNLQQNGSFIYKVEGLFLISYPKGVLSWLVFQKLYTKLNPGVPNVYFVLGSMDQFTRQKTIFNFARNLEIQKSNVKIISEADHFWFAKSDLLLQTLQEWISETTNAAT
eukprot:snap_masked-scaffold_7-processed-gene-14.12-mRNA-1 protein AED:0.42 eAED:1.00 QI:0/-1/0/1/-1/1/1/0/236